MSAVCEHGVIITDAPSAGVAMNALWSMCGCCRFPFFYIDSGSYTTMGHHTRTWLPKDRCQRCGGGYVERTTKPAEPEGWGQP